MIFSLLLDFVFSKTKIFQTIRLNSEQCFSTDKYRNCSLHVIPSSTCYNDRLAGNRFVSTTAAGTVFPQSGAAALLQDQIRHAAVRQC